MRGKFDSMTACWKNFEEPQRREVTTLLDSFYDKSRGDRNKEPWLIPNLKSIWTWDMWNFMTYPIYMLVTLQLLVMIRSLLKLITLFNLPQKIIPYSMTMKDLNWSRGTLFKTTKTIVLNSRLNEWCYSTWTTTLQLRIVLQPIIRMVIFLISNHSLVWMLQWQSYRQSSSILPSEMWWSAILSVNHKETGPRKRNPIGCRIL